MKHRMATGIEESILSNELALGAPSYLKLWFRLGLNSRRSLITQEAGVATGRLVSKLGSGKPQFCVFLRVALPALEYTSINALPWNYHEIKFT